MRKLFVLFIVCSFALVACQTERPVPQKSAAELDREAQAFRERDKRRLEKKQGYKLIVEAAKSDEKSWISEVKVETLCDVGKKFVYVYTVYERLVTKPALDEDLTVNDLGVTEDQLQIIVRSAAGRYAAALLDAYRKNQPADCKVGDTGGPVDSRYAIADRIVWVLKTAQLEPAHVSLKAPELRAMVLTGLKEYAAATRRRGELDGDRGDIINRGMQEYGFSPADVGLTADDLEKLKR